MSVGANDPNWTVSYKDGPSSPAVVAANGYFWKNFSSYAAWISAPSTVTNSVGAFTYTTSFSLTKYDPAHYFLKADVASDDELIGITINGAKIPLLTPCTKTYQYFECTVAYEFTGVFKSGTNTISFIVNNVGGIENPSGLNVNFHI